MSTRYHFGHWQYSTEQDKVLAPSQTFILVRKNIYVDFYEKYTHTYTNNSEYK